MRVTVSGSGALVVLTVLFLAGAATAQAPPSVPPPTAPLPSPGFVPPYEIMRTVRAAGFDPLAPPLREGTTYVLRATDFNGILMRVVVDARTGAIRDANRIVAGPGNYGAAGQVGMAAPTELPPDMMLELYGPPSKFDVPVAPPVAQPPPKRHAKRVAAPPLPRARPAEYVAHRAPRPEIKADEKPETAPATTAVAPVRVPAVVPPIND